MYKSFIILFFLIRCRSLLNNPMLLHIQDRAVGLCKILSLGLYHFNLMLLYYLFCLAMQIQMVRSNAF